MKNIRPRRGAHPDTATTAIPDIGGLPVRITVWRVTGDESDDALTPWMAAALVSTYSSPGELVVSVGDDPTFAGAAGAGGRIYRMVAAPDALDDLAHVAGTVALIVLHWPADTATDDLTPMFDASRRLMRADGCTVIVLANSTYAEHSAALLPAAHRAHLAWFQHIVTLADDLAIHVDLLVFVTPDPRPR